MALHDLPAYSQAYASAGVSLPVHAFEDPEDMLGVAGFEPQTLIAQGEQPLSCPPDDL
jgi:hypothetical protein